MASSGRMPIWVQARDKTMGMLQRRALVEAEAARQSQGSPAIDEALRGSIANRCLDSTPRQAAA